MKRFLLAAVAAFLMLAPGVRAAEKALPADDGSETYRLLNLFGDVFERVRADYVEKVSDADLIKAAISGMLTSLDPHSSYFDADSFRDLRVQTEGQFGGLGIEVSMENGLVKVVSPIDDTPAHRAGLQTGDVITHLDGEPVLGLNLNEAVKKMRGKVGTDIVLTVRREGREPFDVTITRAVIKIRSVRSHLEGNIGYLRITQFNEQAKDGTVKALDKFFAEKGDELQGIILDLRSNPGGLLDQAVGVSDVFLDKGEIVSTRSRHADETQRFNARPGDAAKGLPMVVLINGGSASASEIVAGALQDHARAVLMGTKSFGKGSVQTIIPLGSHGAMKMTTARYYTPSGRSIQKVGIEPDIFVPSARIEIVDGPRRTRESDLRGALTNGEAEGEAAKPEDEAAKPADEAAEPEGEAAGTTAKDEKAPVEDYQLSRAIDLLRGLSLFRQTTAAGMK